MDVPSVTKEQERVFVTNNIAPQFYEFLLTMCLYNHDLEEICQEFSKCQKEFVENLYDRYEFGKLF